MTEKDCATPRPWSIDPSEYPTSTDVCIRHLNESDDPRIARVLVSSPELGDDEGIANAALIVRAVNAHDALVAACEAALRTGMIAGYPGSSIYKQLHDALALAKGEKP